MHESLSILHADAAPQEIQVHLAAILATLPNQAGVYKMLGVQGELLYVGKAKNLKNRVSSYFAKTIEHPKTRALVARIRHIELLLARSETEALLLEQNLIKQHRPPYNILLRDDKSYLYVFVSADQPYPRLAMGRGKAKHQIGKFFGPFPSATSAKDTLLLLQKMFMVRQCDNRFFAQRQRPCLEYQIKRCRAPCVGLVSPDEYAQDVKNTIAFLKGENTELNQRLIGMMEESSMRLEFEQAALYRDQLTMLRDIQAQQAVYTLKGDADVMAIAQQAGVVCVHVLTVRGGRVLGGKSYFPDPTETSDDATLLTEFIPSFYFQIADDCAPEVIVSQPIAELESLQEALGQQFGHRVQLKTRVREVRAEWLEIATLNAEGALKAKLSNQLDIRARFAQLAEVLGQTVDRIECFDISHTMGEAPIASCVVFDQGGARKRDYRQYAITDITGGDDYAAMRQALTRRYSKQPLPDLLLIDGGKGQLNVAKQVMSELGLNTLLLGVSKGEGRKAGLETLHLPNGQTINLPPDHKALHLIQQIRDEAHRFAITKHRAKRDKRRAGSVLELIPNLGEKRRRELLAHFAGMQGLLSASEAEIGQVKGIGQVLARQIYKILHE